MNPTRLARVIVIQVRKSGTENAIYRACLRFCRFEGVKRCSGFVQVSKNYSKAVQDGVKGGFCDRFMRSVHTIINVTDSKTALGNSAAVC